MILALVVARIRHRRGAIALIVGGLACAIAGLLGARVAILDARDAALRNSIRAIDPGERTIRVGVFQAGGGQAVPGGAGADLPRTGFAARTALSLLTGGGASTAHGTAVSLAALDDPGRWLPDRQGRLPTVCRASRCEAVYVGGGERPPRRLTVRGVRLVIVGRGHLSPTPFGRLPPEDPLALNSGNIFLLVRGVREVATMPSLAGAARTYYLTRALDPGAVHPWNVAAILREIQRARMRYSAGFGRDFSAPDELLREFQRRGEASAARLQMIAGQAAAILLAFAAFAAARQRRDVGAELERLRDAGAPRRRLALLIVGEAAVVALAAVVLALAAVIVIGGLAGAGAVVGRVLPAPSGALLVAGAWLASGAALLAGLSESVARRLWRAAEVAVWVLLPIVIWQGARRGSLGVDALAGGTGLDPAILLLPGLVGFAGAALVMRLLPALLHAVERLTRRAGPGRRLFALTLARNGASVGAAVSMLTVAGAAALFAWFYADDLRAGAADQAAFQVGSDMRLTELPGAGYSDPDVLPIGRYARLEGVKATSPVIRSSTRLDLPGRPGTEVQVVGVSASLASVLAGWRDDFSSTPRRRLGELLRPRAGLRLAGDRVPGRARRLTLPARISGTTVSISLIVQGSDDRLLTLPLASQAPPGRYRLYADLPRAARGGRVVSVRVTLIGSGGPQDPQGVVTLGALQAGARVVSRFRRGWLAGAGLSALSFRSGRAQLLVPTFQSQQTFSIVYDQPGLGEPVPALVSSSLAPGDSGEPVTIELPGGQVARFAPVATARRFPTVPDRAEFVVADVGRLFAALNLDTPGSAVPTETWLELDAPADRDSVTAQLGRAPFRVDSLTSRDTLRDSLLTDPLAKVTVTALRITAGAALALAVAALLLSVLATLRDEDGELAELEALGIDPRLLRRQIRAGAASSGLIAAAGAGIAGVALNHVFVALTGLSADGRDPAPPLAAGVPVLAGVALVGLAAVVAAGGVAVVTARAMRGERVGRLHG